MEIITELDKAKPVYEKMFLLTEKKIALNERYKNLVIIEDFKQSQIVGLEIAKLKAELALLRDSIEYVRIKAFILCAKSFLTKQQMKEIGQKADEILSSPEIHLISSIKD